MGFGRDKIVQGSRRLRPGKHQRWIRPEAVEHQVEHAAAAIPDRTLDQAHPFGVHRHDRVAARQIGDDRHGHVAIEHTRDGARNRAVAGCRQLGWKHVQGHVLAAGDAIQPVLSSVQRVASENCVQAELRGDQRRGGQHSAHLEVDHRRSLTAKTEPTQFLGQPNHHPAHLCRERPAFVARRHHRAGRKRLLRRVLQFVQFDQSTHPLGSRGMSSMRSAMMLRCTSSLPPAIVQA